MQRTYHVSCLTYEMLTKRWYFIRIYLNIVLTKFSFIFHHCSLFKSALVEWRLITIEAVSRSVTSSDSVWTRAATAERQRQIAPIRDKMLSAGCARAAHRFRLRREIETDLWLCLMAFSINCLLNCWNYNTINVLN